MNAITSPENAVVSREEWLEARRRLLQLEKEETRLRDRVRAERRALPWVRIDKDYVFRAADGEKRLADLFDGRSQLIVYHFMLGPTGMRAAPAAPSIPIISTARLPT